MVVASRLPKADNTSMAGGRGLLQNVYNSMLKSKILLKINQHELH